MNEQYADRVTMEEITKVADSEQLWVEELAVLPDEFEGPPILFNHLNVALWKPHLIFETIQLHHEEGEEVSEEYAPHKRHYNMAAPTPMVRDDKCDVARPLGYMRVMCELGCDLLGRRDYMDAHLSFIDVVKQPSWAYAGVNPLGDGVHEYYGHIGPVRVELADTTSGELGTDEPQSAGEVSW